MRIDIPDDLIMESASAAVRRTFTTGRYGSDDGHGHREIQLAVDAAVKLMDFSDAIGHAIAKQLPGVIEAVVGGALERAVKAEIKRLKKSSALEHHAQQVLGGKP